MKKYLLFLITIVSLSLAGCSTDDDYCGNGIYKSDQVIPKSGYHPFDFKVRGLTGDTYIVIDNERDFQDRVVGANYYRNEINFRDFNLIIGQTFVRDFDSIIDILPMYKESCNYSYDNILDIELILNRGRGRYSDYITYHTLVPRTRSTTYTIHTFPRFKN